MKRILFLLMFSFCFKWAMYSQTGNGHYPSVLLSYVPGEYTVSTYMRQDKSFPNDAKNTINNRSTACDLFVNFTFDTSGKNVFLVYTTNGTTPTKSNGNSVLCSFSNYSSPNRTFLGQIPSSFTGGTMVRYIFYISDSDLNSAWGRVAGNTGYSTSWTEGDDYYNFDVKYSNSFAGGSWSSASSWVNSTAPSGDSFRIEILSSTSGILLDQNVTLSTILVWSGGSFTASDANPRILTLTKSTAGDEATLVNNGTWVNGVGGSTIVFTGAPSSGDARHQITGTIDFDNVTVNKTGGSSNVGASFAAGATVSGTLRIGNGGFISTDPPVNFYGENAILDFNQGVGAEYVVNNGDKTWSTTEIPNNITITSGTVTLNEARSFTGELLIQSGAQINTNGYLTQQSSATATASLLSYGTVSGNVTVERFISAASWGAGNDGWHMVSSPVATQAISGGWTPDGTLSNDYDFYSWDETTQYWLNQKLPANNITTFEVGSGYMIAYQAESTNTFVGAPNQADVADIALTRTTAPYTDPNDAGFNLLGNPYPCALKWNDGNWTYTNVSTTAKIWNSSTKSYIDLGANDIIPSMNGFMVQLTSGTSGSITIPSASRLHNSTSWYKSTSVENESIKLIAREVDNQSAQNSVIRVDQESTIEYNDQFDSRFLAGYAPLFYSLKGDSKLSTFSMPELSENLVIPFGFVKNTSTEFTIELAETIEGKTIYLTDLKTNTTQNLSENPIFSFTSEENDDPNRFTLHFGPVGISTQPTQPQVHAYVNGQQLTILGEGHTQVDIFDVQGRLLSSEMVNVSGSYSRVLNLNSGLYIVRLQNNRAVSSTKVIVK